MGNSKWSSLKHILVILTCIFFDFSCYFLFAIKSFFAANGHNRLRIKPSNCYSHLLVLDNLLLIRIFLHIMSVSLLFSQIYFFLLNFSVSLSLSFSLFPFLLNFFPLLFLRICSYSHSASKLSTCLPHPILRPPLFLSCFLFCQHYSYLSLLLELLQTSCTDACPIRNGTNSFCVIITITQVPLVLPNNSVYRILLLKIEHLTLADRLANQFTHD